MSLQESPTAVPASAPTPLSTFTVWRTAPVRLEPFVGRSSEHPEDESTNPDNNNVVDTILGETGVPPAQRRHWPVFAQCRGSRIDVVPSSVPVWNDYWLLTAGPNGAIGWISMVDVDEGGNGQKKADVPVGRYEWTQVANL